MKTLVLALGCSLLFLAKCVQAQDTELVNNAFKNEAKALVIVNLTKDFKQDEVSVVTLNVDRSEAETLQELALKAGAKNIKIIAFDDFSKKYPGKTYQDVNAINLLVNLISCTQDDAILTGGTSMKVPGGWTDRFYLMRLNGKWTLAARVNYEVR